jgi:3-hydroxyanthranilate 3,4-dioxygenase
MINNFTGFNRPGFNQMFQAINIKEWVENNSHLLQPPVNNYCLYNEKDFTVMLIGGPNVRRDYHV